MNQSGTHLLRLAVLALAAVCRTRLPYRLLGLVNRRNGTIRTVFLCYAGSPSYSRRYCYRWSENWLRESPTPIGIYRQDGRWGLVLASPISEGQILDQGRSEQLDRLLDRVQMVAEALGAQHVRLAGILPGLLRRRGRAIPSGSREIVAHVVLRSVRRVQEGAGSGLPLVLLGGDGYIGRALQDLLRRSGQAFHVLDRTRGADSLLPELRKQPVLLVDVSRRGVINHYSDQLAAGSLVLNEAFPEPDRDLVKRLHDRGCSVLHIAGVEAQVYPSLPGGYRGAVPCCAVHGCGSLEPVLLALGGER